MSDVHPGVTGKSPPDTSDDPIAALPPFVSIKRTSEILGLSRATIWRRITDGTLEIASGSGAGRKRLVLKTSIQRFVEPAQVHHEV